MITSIGRFRRRLHPDELLPASTKIMTPFNLNPKKIALVVIDLQKAIAAMPTAPYSAAEVVQKSILLARKFREKSATVV
jgi:hypothetical protein